jgi:4-hydroxy-L-threonine phosphate dehydrogenase PdxA
VALYSETILRKEKALKKLHLLQGGHDVRGINSKALNFSRKTNINIGVPFNKFV